MMVILININILAMVLDLMRVKKFCNLMAVGFGKNVTFDDMSLLVHIDNKK